MRIVLIYSGGLDSTVLLYKLRAEVHEVLTLSVDYGQRHRHEVDQASLICKMLGVEHQVADLSALRPLLGGSSQTDDFAVPHGHYAEESMKLTIVPNRNMLMLAVAGAWAISRKADSIAYAAHAGDHAIYPDCREEFVAALDTALGLADWYAVKIIRPFVKLSKADIVLMGVALRVPFGMTYSCYEGVPGVHCGECGICVERREAFEVAGVDDPTKYAKENADVQA